MLIKMLTNDGWGRHIEAPFDIATKDLLVAWREDASEFSGMDSV